MSDVSALISHMCECSSGLYIFFFKQKTAYEMRISDWSSDVCSSDLLAASQELFQQGCNIGFITTQDKKITCAGTHRGQYHIRIAVGTQARNGDIGCTLDPTLHHHQSRIEIDALELEENDIDAAHPLHALDQKSGRASCWDRACLYAYISRVA